MIWSAYAPRFQPDEFHTTDADDGWRLGLHRFRPVAADAHAEPVLLVHGLGANATMFHLGVGTEGEPVPGLATWLAQHGYDVWVPDLRGSGASSRPGPASKRRWDWNVDDLIERDIPAVVDYVRSRSAHEQLHWIGHSLGGILLLCYCGLHGGAHVRSGTAVAAALDYSATGSAYRLIRPLRHVGLGLRRIPAGTLGRLLAPLSGRLSGGAERWGYWPPNLAPAAARAISAGVLEDVSGAVLFQLATLFVPGGLRSGDGRIRYAELEAQIQTPMHLLAGSHDVQCGPEAVTRTYRRLSGEAHCLTILGRAHGTRENYGHFDLLAGRRADREVYPRLLSWLQRHKLRAVA